MDFKNPFRSYFPVIFAMLFWSLSFVWYKQVFVHYTPITLIVFRLCLALPLLTISSLFLKKLQIIKRKDLMFFMLLAFFEPFLYFIGECFGVNMISPTLAAVIISLIPLFAPIPAWYIFREKFTLTNFTGLIVSIIGVILVITGEENSGHNSLSGVLLMLLAVFSAVCHSVFVRKLSSAYNTFTIVTYQNLFGLIYFIPLFAFNGLNEFIRMQHTFAMVLPVIKLAVFASSIAFLLFVHSIQTLGMARTNVFINLIPVFTAFLSYLLLDEKFTAVKMTGIGVVITGLIFSQYNRQSRFHVKEKAA